MTTEDQPFLRCSVVKTTTKQRKNGGVGVFPGSFDPLTVAHLAIADAVVAQLGLARLDVVLSEVALDKDHGGHSPLADRVAAVEAKAGEGRPWLSVRLTSDRLIADIADGYDVCVMGADKWHQLFDLRFYDGSIEARDAAVARLPLLAVAPRDGSETPTAEGVVVLDVDPQHRCVSSSAVRAGRVDWRV